MKLIETRTIASVTSTISFTSIPSTFTDLVLLVSARNTGTNTGIFVRFNSDSGSNYIWRRLLGDGVSRYTDNNSTYGGVYNQGIYWTFFDISTNTANTFGNGIMTVTNYASSTTKPISADASQETNATSAYQGITSGLWTGTAAINSVTLTWEGGANFDVGSMVSLYGITKGTDGVTTVS